MTSRTVTLLDVARAAGVSKSTVSDALQGSGRVAAATRDRVRAVAEELGYRPNSAARRLRRSSTGAIGLHLPRTATRLDYYMNLAFGAVERAQEEGFDVVLLAPTGAAGGGDSKGSPDSTGPTRLTNPTSLTSPVGRAATPSGPIASRVDGLLVIDPEVDDSAVPGLLDGGVPVVTGERYLGPTTAPTGAVICDNAASLTALLDHVTERGARHPAVLAPAGTSAWATALRATADSWARERKVAVALRTVPFAATPGEAEETTLALLRTDPSVDAVICAPDGAAPGVLRAAATLGRPVGPGALRAAAPHARTATEPGARARTPLLVASCVDGTATRSAEPPVTAVDLRPAAYGRACAELLCDILAGRTTPDTVRRHAWALETRAST
ncbi:LacI family DNA-binding transcriptional regulator [Streptomyces sp. SID8359]|uniref:LacI family DNA-binding transcriptional regulator n=1 Tax=unclassified Streptomyces TaxID=2593676 RepID=UPI00048E69ED|nr:LacI family DNA-binding transcriptional regulator [Streptomyces sp. SolWspMP-sol2th]MYT90318.1 LacI family DNA-binding transcriptional regulator [Streptomyces sp. SID8359]